jgi:valyl-tRNA synthetase
MGKRFRDWTENLAFDWCVSRQRFFGVPIPVWYPLDDQGVPRWDAAIVAEPEQMPVDPMEDIPHGYEESQRGRPGGFGAEPDIFDTWFTSSMTPQISSHWAIDAERHRTLFPADLRPQGQDIIRTWAFYTIAKALLHEESVPWYHAAISGWILDPDRKKMSKSKGNVVTPIPMIDSYGADAVRYWSGSARLGVDTAIDEKIYKIGKRLMTKVFNASKFVLSQTAPRHPISVELDRAFIAELRQLVAQATASFEKFDHAHALMDTESFFWNRFTDTYIELTKTRARDEAPAAEAARGSAVAALRLGLSVLLRLLAPFMPYITEEIWSWAFAVETGHPSIHRAPWPQESELDAVASPQDTASFETAVLAQAAINKVKADAQVGMGREVEHLSLAAHPATLERLRPALDDVLSATRCLQHRLEAREDLEEGIFEVSGARFVERG